MSRSAEFFWLVAFRRYRHGHANTLYRRVLEAEASLAPERIVGDSAILFPASQSPLPALRGLGSAL